MISFVIGFFMVVVFLPLVLLIGIIDAISGAQHNQSQYSTKSKEEREHNNWGYIDYSDNKDK